MKKFLMILLTVTIVTVSIISPSVYAVDTSLTDEYYAETTPDPMEDLPGNGMISTEDQPLDIFKPTTPTLVVENGQDFETVLMSLTDSSLTGADIAPGVYRIKNVYSSLYVDIHGPSMQAGALIHQWTFHTDTTELWEIEPYSLNSNYYTIRSLYSNLYLGVTAININTDNVVQTIVADPDGIAHTDATLWRIYENDSGQFALFPKSGESYMNVLTAPSTSNGDELIQTEYTDDNAKYWCIESLETVASGTYLVKNAEYGTCLQIDDDSSANTSGAIMEILDFDGGNDQRWEFEYMNNGYYSIISYASDLALTAPTSVDSSITQTTFIEADNQQWMITPNSDGDYIITSKSNYARYMAAGDISSSTEDRNVESRSVQSNEGDEWELITMELKIEFTYDNGFIQENKSGTESDQQTKQRIEDNIENTFFPYLSNAFYEMYGVDFILTSVNNYTSSADGCSNSGILEDCDCIEVEDCVLAPSYSPQENNRVTGYQYQSHCKNITRQRNDLVANIPDNTMRITYIGHEFCYYVNESHTFDSGLAALSNYDYPIVCIVTSHSNTQLSSLLLAHEISHNFGVVHHAGEKKCIMNTSDGTRYSTIDVTKPTQYWCEDCINEIRHNISNDLIPWR